MDDMFITWQVYYMIGLCDDDFVGVMSLLVRYYPCTWFEDSMLGDMVIFIFIGV